MLIFYFIRHGATAGNLKKQYIGSTDEPLCDEGRRQLENALWADFYPRDVDRVYVSPLARTMESARILYPEKKPVAIDGLREKDFGVYEGKSFEDLKDDAPYQAWLASGGALPFPGGEPFEQAKARGLAAFDALMGNFRALYQDAARDIKIAFVVHGGTIMTILSERLIDGASFYDYQCGNGALFAAHAEGGRLVLDARKELSDLAEPAGSPDSAADGARAPEMRGALL